MVKNTDFNGSLDSNPYKFQHYDISDFSLFVNGKYFPKEGLTVGTDRENTSVMGYRKLFEASGIHHSNTGLQITHNMYITAISCYYLASQLIGVRRRVIRPTQRTAVSGTN